MDVFTSQVSLMMHKIESFEGVIYLTNLFLNMYVILLSVISNVTKKTFVYIIHTRMSISVG